MTGANNFSVSGYGPERPVWTRIFARDSLARRLDWPITAVGPGAVPDRHRPRLLGDPQPHRDNQGDPYYFLIRHLMNTGIGLALMVGTIWLGHRTLRTAVPSCTASR